jgi:thiosulfate/3-mercaptopyruvate sulfurtransferase
MKTVTITVTFVLFLSLGALAQPADPITKAEITPQALLRVLQSNQRGKLLILNVAPRILYAQAHIEGAEYIGPTNDPRGIEVLRNRVKSVPKNKQIIVYCGCCPWDHCPNVRPAFAELKKLGFENVKVLHISNNFGTDWVDQGLPVARGM